MNCGSIRKGDVILSNHPGCGGSHLPDLTVITPVFNQHADRPVFFVANRGHHSDIGKWRDYLIAINVTFLIFYFNTVLNTYFF